MPAATTKSLVVRVHVLPGDGHKGSNKIEFRAVAAENERIAVEEPSVFILPR